MSKSKVNCQKEELPKCTQAGENRGDRSTNFRKTNNKYLGEAKKSSSGDALESLPHPRGGQGFNYAALKELNGWGEKVGIRR